MLQKSLALVILSCSTTLFAAAQDCKLKFSVAYNDGDSVQIGLTNDQQKMWDHDGPKKFRGLCLDDKSPDFVILWNQGLNGSELVKTGMERFNRLYAEGQYTATSATYGSVPSAHVYVRSTSQVQGKAYYSILDASKKPPVGIRQGEGYQDVPMGNTTRAGQTVKPSDAASTVADPAEALSNALKWLKKEKKL